MRLLLLLTLAVTLSFGATFSLAQEEKQPGKAEASKGKSPILNYILGSGAVFTLNSIGAENRGIRIDPATDQLLITP